jgi:phosphoglucosamine mutase
VALGRAAATVLGGERWLIGADTRASGPMLVAALAAGLASAGADVADLGVLPTPAVAFASATEGVPAAVVSASHNPWSDNGIKVLGPGGRKLADDVEAAISAQLEHPRADVGKRVGAIDRASPDLARLYADHVAGALDGRDLAGCRVVVDCANGAASFIAPAVLERLGVDLVVLSAAPDGTNINDGCGSTYPGPLQAAVVAAGADAGLAFDGDADRVLAVTGSGELVDGDQILALCAADLQARGRLPGAAIAVTVMSNLGLRLALAEGGIGVVETPVGDRYVLEAMERDGLALGGEQSGHIIFRELATTGDGLLTGVLLLDVVRRRGRSLADAAAAAMTRLPQVLHNVRAPAAAAKDPAVLAAVADAEAGLGGHGRVVLRPSGTEPLVRVMVEAPTEAEAGSIATRLAAVVASVPTGGAAKRPGQGGRAPGSLGANWRLAPWRRHP